MASDSFIGEGLAPSPYQELLDENTNLKNELAVLTSIKRLMQERDAARAEVEALKHDIAANEKGWQRTYDHDVEALRHDIARHVQITSEQAGEIERLRAELASRPKQWWLPWAPVEAARRMHLAYEHFASDFGYETRTDTKVWNPDSANGQLMVAVIRNVFIEQASDAALAGKDSYKELSKEDREAVDLFREDYGTIS
jgi:hypothetical protein